MDPKDLEQYVYIFMSWIKGNTRVKVVRLHIDNAPEFITLRSGFEKLGIVLTTSSA